LVSIPFSFARNDTFDIVYQNRSLGFFKRYSHFLKDLRLISNCTLFLITAITCHKGGGNFYLTSDLYYKNMTVVNDDRHE